MHKPTDEFSYQAIQRDCKALNPPQLLWAVGKEADWPGLLLTPGSLAADSIAALSPVTHHMMF